MLLIARCWPPAIFVTAVLGAFAVAGLPPAANDDPPSKEAANFKPYTETIPGSDVKFGMVPIPGGTFVMGSPQSEKGRGADEGPQHPVTIRPF